MKKASSRNLLKKLKKILQLPIYFCVFHVLALKYEIPKLEVQQSLNQSSVNINILRVLQSKNSFNQNLLTINLFLEGTY